MSDLQSKLERLYILLNTGVLSEPEFEKRKAELIDAFVKGSEAAAVVAGTKPKPVLPGTASGGAAMAAPTASSQQVAAYEGPLVCCRLRGLPFTVTSNEVATFLDGCDVDWDNGGIKLVMDENNESICSGIAYVLLTSEEAATQCMQLKDKQNLGHRYIEVSQATIAEMIAGQISRTPGKVGGFQPSQPQRFTPYGKGKGKGKGTGKGQGMGMGKGKGKGKGYGAVTAGTGTQGWQQGGGQTWQQPAAQTWQGAGTQQTWQQPQQGTWQQNAGQGTWQQNAGQNAGQAAWQQDTTWQQW